MLYEPMTTTQEMDFYNIDAKCWQCQHYQGGYDGKCTSDAVVQGIKDLSGVDFKSVALMVNQDTDAGLCSEFELSKSQQVLLEIEDMLHDARIEAQRHLCHYRHLRRTAHAY